ncbi:MAG TPA: VTT domain-containing protein [Acidobacteriaceae bacterium]|jgi:membrane protein DedA with SNARE-associated domain/rhodanese-related sulfurtransferase|nr:VTT domain-containing protein [Acidobacteriaceae bacterium]
MPVAIDFFLKYGYSILFLWVLVEQLGVPIPSVPLLLAAGTLTSTHKMNLWLVLLSVLLGSIISDSAWYWMGRKYGGAVVKLLCRLSMESNTCVRRTENFFAKRGPSALVVSKFIPGLGTVAPPIAGQTGMRYRHFALYDAAGIMLWAVTFTLGGRFFGDVIKRHPGALEWMGRFGFILFVLLLISFFIWRFFRQRAFLRELRMARIDPRELKEMLDRGQPVYIVDLRHPLDYMPDPRTLPGAVLITPDNLVAHCAELPRDRDVVLFCTCPSEATSAKMALAIRKLGVYRVRPLLGGFDEWKRLGYPLVEIEPAAAMA